MPWLAGTATVLAVGAVGLWTAPRWLVPLIAARSPRCLYTVTAHEKVVALTIDDGPDREYTRTILAVLRKNQAHASFFLISGNVPGAEPVVSELVSAGHEIGNHLTRDEPSIRLSATAFVAAMREAGTTLGRFAQVRWLRPGSGWYDDAMLDAIEREGYRCALGSVYPYDGHGMPARVSSAYILANVAPGAVIILHEGKGRGTRTATVLASVLPTLRARGYQVVTLSELHARSSRGNAGSSPQPP